MIITFKSELMTTPLPEVTTHELTTELTATPELTSHATTEKIDETAQNHMDTTTISDETSTTEQTTGEIKSTAEMTTDKASTTEKSTSIDGTSKNYITTSGSTSTNESSTAVEATKQDTTIITIADTTTVETQPQLTTEEMSTTTQAMPISDSYNNFTSTLTPWAGESTTTAIIEQFIGTTTSASTSTSTTTATSTITSIITTITSTEASTAANNITTVETTIETLSSTIPTLTTGKTTTSDIVSCESETNCILSIRSKMIFRGVYHDAYVNLKNNQSENLIAFLNPLIKHVTFNNSVFNSENLTLDIIEISKSDEHESAIDVEVLIQRNQTVNETCDVTCIDNQTKKTLTGHLKSYKWIQEMDFILKQEYANNEDFKNWADGSGFEPNVGDPASQTTTPAITTGFGYTSNTSSSTSTVPSRITTTSESSVNIGFLFATLEFEGEFRDEYNDKNSVEFKNFSTLMKPILLESIGSLGDSIENIEFDRLYSGSIVAELEIQARKKDLNNLERLIGNDKESCADYIPQHISQNFPQNGSKCWEEYIDTILERENKNNEQIPKEIKSVTEISSSVSSPMITSSSAVTRTKSTTATTMLVTTSTSTTTITTTTATKTTSIITSTTILSTTTAEKPYEVFNLTIYSDSDTHEISFNVIADEDYLERAKSERDKFVDEKPNENVYLSVVSEPQKPSNEPPPDMVFSLIHQYFKPVKVNKCSDCSEAEIASKNNEQSLFKAAKCFMHHEKCN